MSNLLPARAHFFDGDVPVPHDVDPRVEGTALQVTLEDGRSINWPLEEIRLVQDSAAATNAVLRWTKDPLARLILRDSALLRQMPKLNRSAPPKGRARLAAWAVAAVAAVALQIGVLVPLLADNLARFIPPEGERALGEATFGHIRTALDETGLNPVPICDGAEGQAALEALVGRLSVQQDLRQQVTVSVLDHQMVNAFALPGGYVVLFRGLIEAANNPDEVAAVLAHEVGHVVSRDPTRHALRSAGSIGVLGLLLGDFAGGAVVLFLAERLISASYSQEAESNADAFAHAALEAARISPGALGDMFSTMRDKHGDNDGIASHFLSHPALGKRIEAAYAAMRAAESYQPSMTEIEWAALRRICAD